MGGGHPFLRVSGLERSKQIQLPEAGDGWRSGCGKGLPLSPFSSLLPSLLSVLSSFNFPFLPPSLLPFLQIYAPSHILRPKPEN